MLLKSLESPSAFSTRRVEVNKDSLERVSDILCKCQRDNGITIIAIVLKLQDTAIF